MLEKDSLKDIHVLIAEDNDDTRELMEIVLAHAAARVTSAQDGEAALEVIRNLVPDILLADLALPKRDGFWLIAQVRALPAKSGGGIPAIAFSALVAPPDIARAKALGYTAYVAKPADPSELAHMIARLVVPTPLVLVVDDHAEVRELYAEILRGQGFRVETAISGLDGIVKAAVLAPSLIMMDLAMPDMDGWEATRQLRASPGTMNVPILVLSAHGLDQYREAAVAAGCNGFLTKPVVPEDLLREVRRLLAC